MLAICFGLPSCFDHLKVIEQHEEAKPEETVGGTG